MKGQEGGRRNGKDGKTQTPVFVSSPFALDKWNVAVFCLKLNQSYKVLQCLVKKTNSVMWWGPARHFRGKHNVF